MQATLPPHIWQQDFKLKGVVFRAVLDPSKSEPLRIYRGKHLVSSIARKRWSPWKLDVGDVDGDGSPDFAIGIVKPTRFIKKPHSTVFFYTFDGKHLTKKWLASSLGRPLIDFCLGPPTKKGRSLWTLERTSGGKVAASYGKWSGFGFVKEGPEKVFETADRIVRSKGKIAVVVDGQIVPLDFGVVQ